MSKTNNKVTKATLYEFIGKMGQARNEYLRNYFPKVIDKNAIFMS